MYDAVSFTEIENQQVELVPGRTMMQTGPSYENIEEADYDDNDFDLYFDDYFDEMELSDISETDPPHHGPVAR